MDSKFISIIRQRAFNGVWVNNNGTTPLDKLSLSYLRNIYKFCEQKGYPYTDYLSKIEYEINRKLSR